MWGEPECLLFIAGLMDIHSCHTSTDLSQQLCLTACRKQQCPGNNNGKPLIISRDSVMLAARARAYTIEYVHALTNLYSSKLVLHSCLPRQSSQQTTGSSGPCSAVQASAGQVFRSLDNRKCEHINISEHAEYFRAYTDIGNQDVINASE